MKKHFRTYFFSLFIFAFGASLIPCYISNINSPEHAKWKSVLCRAFFLQSCLSLPVFTSDNNEHHPFIEIKIEHGKKNTSLKLMDLVIEMYKKNSLMAVTIWHSSFNLSQLIDVSRNYFCLHPKLTLGFDYVDSYTLIFLKSANGQEVLNSKRIQCSM
jgi:hypothetical protein